MLADFHMHSTFSDGALSIPELVDLFGARGFGAIAITDHLCETETLMGRAARYIGRTLTPATFSLYQEILRSEAKRAWQQYEMVVIPGFEISKNSVSNKRSAHILALGVTEWISADQDALSIAREIRQKGGLAVAAHPVPTRKSEKQTLYLWDQREQLREAFDAWEISNGPYLFDEVLQSGLPILANGDLHQRRQLSSWKTVLDCKRNVGSIFRAIKRQELSYQFYFDTKGVQDVLPSSDRDFGLVGGTDIHALRNLFNTPGA